MRRITPLLAGTYTGAALVLLGQAVYANRRGDTAAMITLSLCAILLALAAAHTCYLADELSSALMRLERKVRPDGPDPAVIDDEIAYGLEALARACCLPAAVTAGAEHDPDHCTRKDTTA